MKQVYNRIFHIFVMLSVLSGCSTTVPVVAKFPEVPNRLMTKCPSLEKLNDDATISDISKTVSNNYSTYYQCAVIVDSWIEWYQVQKHIFENIK